MSRRISYHAISKEARMAHCSFSNARHILEDAVMREKFMRTRNNGHIELRAEGYYGKLICDKQLNVITVCELD